MRSTAHFQPFAILPILILIAALVLSFLCLFIGDHPGFMDDYAIVTVNMSRLGQNTLNRIDNRILGLNVSKIINKRDEIPMVFVSVTSIVSIPAPTATLQERQLGAFINSIKSEAGDAIGGAVTAVETKASAAVGAVSSAANSVEGIVVSKIQSAISSLQTAAVDVVDEVYLDVVSGLNLTDFYALNLRTTCEGRYVAANGTNLTLSTTLNSTAGVKKDVDVCSVHSKLNPLILIRALFVVAIAFACLALLTSIWGLIRFSKVSAVLNILVVMPALGFLAVAVAISHGLAVGLLAFLNFFAEAVGAEVTHGNGFFAMAWAAVVLLFLAWALWVLLLLFGARSERVRSEKGPLMMEEKTSHGKRRFWNRS